MNLNKSTKPFFKKFFLAFGVLLLISILLLVIAWFATAPKQKALGVWQSQGHGYIFSISRFMIDAYEVTEVSCMRTARFPSNSWLLEKAEGASFTVNDSVLEARAGSLEPLVAKKLPELPNNCKTPEVNTPRHNFDVFWHTFNEHYAFFDLHGVDWQARYDEAQKQLTDDITNEELFDLMAHSFRGLDDGHIYLTKDSENFVGPSEGDAWFDSSEKFSEIALSYLQEDYTYIENTGIRYGYLNDSIGFIQISDMNVNVGFGKRESDAVRDAMKQVAADLNDTKILIIDVRFNPGGTDFVSMAIAELFTNDGQEVFSKSTKEQNGLSEPFVVSLKPKEKAIFQQEVYLLTSSATGSAAEIFSLAMSELPQVTLVGTNSGGALSDALERKLPNGWSFSLSNQHYFSVDGTLLEGVGVSPDLERNFDVENFLNGKDMLLEEVIAINSF